MIATMPPATVEELVRNAYMFGGPILVLFLLVATYYDYKPDQIAIPLTLWYSPGVEALARKVYEQLVDHKEEAISEMNKQLAPYLKLLGTFLQAAGLSIESLGNREQTHPSV